MNELAPRPSQPCQPIPNGLVSLWDVMIRVNADFFATLPRTISGLGILVKPEARASETLRAEIVEMVGSIKEMLLAFGLTTSVVKCERIVSAVPSTGTIGVNYARAVEVLNETIEDELRGKYVFLLASDRSRFYPNNRELFGPDVQGALDDHAIKDLEEAGKCLAFGRDTAAVFHLMRILERALASIGKVLEVKNPKPGWDDYLAALDNEVAKEWKDRKIKGHHQHVSEVTAHLRAVKNAWRNPSMHISGSYDFEKASEIFDAIKGLMKAIVASEVFELVERPS